LKGGRKLGIIVKLESKIIINKKTTGLEQIVRRDR
jgi:hypothetical protein